MDNASKGRPPSDIAQGRSRRFVAGWWILPVCLGGFIIWGVIIVLVLRALA